MRPAQRQPGGRGTHRPGQSEDRVLASRGLGLHTPHVSSFNPWHDLMSWHYYYSHFTEVETEVSQLLLNGFDPLWHAALGQEMLSNPVSFGQVFFFFLIILISCQVENLGDCIFKIPISGIP